MAGITNLDCWQTGNQNEIGFWGTAPDHKGENFRKWRVATKSNKNN